MNFHRLDHVYVTGRDVGAAIQLNRVHGDYTRIYGTRTSRTGPGGVKSFVTRRTMASTPDRRRRRDFFLWGNWARPPVHVDTGIGLNVRRRPNDIHVRPPSSRECFLSDVIHS